MTTFTHHVKADNKKVYRTPFGTRIYAFLPVKPGALTPLLQEATSGGIYPDYASNTAKTHTHHILQKLGCRAGLQAVAGAPELKLLY